MSVAFTNRHILEERIAGFHSQPSADHLSIIRHAAIFPFSRTRSREAWALAALGQCRMCRCAASDPANGW